MSNQDLPEELRGILSDECYAECISFDVDAGWHSLLKDLLVFIAERNPDTRVHQVKEKFGGLRFYVGQTTEEIRAAINEVEKASFHICDTCGKPAITSGKFWLVTRCEPCIEELRLRRQKTV
jgi:hypothetical protein